jgi:hypothetical protein
MTSTLIKKQAGGLRVFSLVRVGLRGKMFENHCPTVFDTACSNPFGSKYDFLASSAVFHCYHATYYQRLTQKELLKAKGRWILGK